MLRQKLLRVLLIWDHICDRLWQITAMSGHGLRLYCFLGFYKFILRFWVLMRWRLEWLWVAVLDRFIDKLIDVAAWFYLLIGCCRHSQVIWFGLLFMLIGKLNILLELGWLPWLSQWPSRLLPQGLLLSQRTLVLFKPALCLPFNIQLQCFLQSLISFFLLKQLQFGIQLLLNRTLLLSQQFVSGFFFALDVLLVRCLPD